jgi:hypothetical protein
MLDWKRIFTLAVATDVPQNASLAPYTYGLVKPKNCNDLHAKRENNLVFNACRNPRLKPKSARQDGVCHGNPTSVHKPQSTKTPAAYWQDCFAPVAAQSCRPANERGSISLQVGGSIPLSPTGGPFQAPVGFEWGSFLGKKRLPHTQSRTLHLRWFSSFAHVSEFSPMKSP